jgi:glycosyltransferase involved in cell wall biosynthesis
MRVAIDLQTVFTERTGVGQYAYYLACNLPRAGPDDEFIGLAFGRCRGAEDLEGPNVRVRRVGLLPRRGVSLLWKTIGWPAADLFTGPVDVFHFPSFIARPLRSARAVVTIHDLAFKRMPEYSEPKNAAFLARHVPRTLERARLVLVDSEFTARELAALYGYPAERIRVTHLGVAEHFHPRRPEESDEGRRRHGLPPDFILCVATVEPRKNIGTLLAAYRLLRDRGSAPALVIVGSDGWRGEGERVERMVGALGLSNDVIRRRYISHAELPAVLSAARLFVFPALYEGFGLPPLEAMACGTPVVCSDAASLPEVVGDAALLVPPRDAVRMAEAMVRALDDPGIREAMITKGLERARRFTWLENARRTLAAYREAVSA